MFLGYLLHVNYIRLNMKYSNNALSLQKYVSKIIQDSFNGPFTSEFLNSSVPGNCSRYRTFLLCNVLTQIIFDKLMNALCNGLYLSHLTARVVRNCIRGEMKMSVMQGNEGQVEAKCSVQHACSNSTAVPPLYHSLVTIIIISINWRGVRDQCCNAVNRGEPWLRYKEVYSQAS